MQRNAVTIATLQTFLALAAASNPDSPIAATDIEHTISDRSWMERAQRANQADATTYDELEADRPDPEAVTVDVYDWVGLDEIVKAFRALIAQAKFWPHGAIYAADVTRTISEIEHQALLEAAAVYSSDWRLFTPLRPSLTCATPSATDRVVSRG